MKRFVQLTILSAVALSAAAFAQTGKMDSAEMKKDCMDMKGKDMKGTDMKGMDMKGCNDMMKEHASDSKGHKTAKKGAVHKASAVVKAVDPATGKVTLEHGAVKSLNWPPMTMAFGVKDKALLDKLAVGKHVDVEFTQQGSNYVVSAVR